MHQGTTRRAVVVVVLSALAVTTSVTCGKSKQEDSRTGPFHGVSAKKLLEKWQGTWVMPFRSGRGSDKSPFGNREIWTIRGSRLKRDDGLKTREYQIKIVAPCLARLTRPLRGRLAKRVRYHSFTFSGDVLIVGDQGGFVRRGTTFACDSSIGPIVVVKRGGACHLWEKPIISRADQLEKKKVSCSVVTKGGQRYFEVRADNFYRNRKRWKLSGDRLERLPNPSTPARRYASPAAARKALLGK